ncbi:aromatic-ring-hydroxylating dioxygenase subunit beta [Nocardia miyunensis]|uniref:aromatic-ring-hydroxylating dioxygenase subunit beta n=1 Tax=Nocardia miyunensis TaxID=282684 RepID=UPI00082B4ECF|nr:3-phenylpropionate/cinnamic acid dioxygenase subunit beta [Nocardia miyunensis]
MSDKTLGPVAISPQTHLALSDFLFAEADLLDAWKFEDWLELLAPDIHYWAPVRENRVFRERSQEISPPGTSAYFEENYDDLAQRVERLYTHMAWAEEPPTRTRHLISNIRVSPSSTEDGAFDVQSSFYVHRTRLERDHDWMVGVRSDVIRPADTRGGFQIAKREILFDVSTFLAKNLSSFY